jgi:hypothetical protein
MRAAEGTVLRDLEAVPVADIEAAGGRETSSRA